MDFSINAPQKVGLTFSKWVFFAGTTALLEGQGVCYQWDYSSDEGDTGGVLKTAVDARRTNRVELPTITNARFFAGVAARNYSAKSTGQLIEIFAPGSTCNILSKASTTIGVGILTCEAGGDYAGYFRYAGFEGEGSAVPLQTVDRSTDAGACLAILQSGVPSGLTEYIDVDTGGSMTCMVGGVTVLDATGTPGTDATFTMADGTIAGLLKKFICIVDYGNSYDFIITVNGVEQDGTALTTVILDDEDDEVTLQWFGDWSERLIVGATKT
jgi:hypothetical protein